VNVEAALDAVQHLAGFAIVMIALTGLWGLASLSAWLMARLGPPPAPARAPAPVLPAGPGAGVPEDDLVVVAAAAAFLVRGRHRILSIRPVSSSWGQQGRRDIHASHRFR